MYAKLNSDAEFVAVLKTKFIGSEYVQTSEGARKFYRNTTQKVTQWRLTEGPSVEDVELMGDYANQIIDWSIAQNEAVSEAFAKNMKNGIAGGKPVVMGSKPQKALAERGIFGHIKNAKHGEFSGLIQGGRSIAHLMPKTAQVVQVDQPAQAPEPAQVAQKDNNPILMGMVTDQLKQASSGLLKAINEQVQSGQGVTKEEIYDIYEAERQIYYTLTRGLGVKANEYETARRKAADQNFSKSKKGDFGMSLRQAADYFAQN